MTDCLLTEQRGQVLWITLNRPNRLNALTEAMITELRELFENLRRRPDIRVVILRGTGRGFCAGLDLTGKDGFEDQGVGVLLDGQRRIAEIVIAMRRCPQPIIAMVQGPASGGGFALALASDVRIATPDARFNAAFIKVGLSACDIGVSYFLPRMVGFSVASELLLTGAFLEADRAVQMGLVSRIVPPDALEGEATTLAGEMLNATPLGLRLTKEALSFAVDAQGLEAVVAMEDRNQILCVKDENFEEGIRAFLEKRKPDFDRPG